MALSAEIKVLEREFLRQPVSVDLLKAKRDREAASVVRIGRRVDALDHLVNDKRELEAEAATS